MSYDWWDQKPTNLGIAPGMRRALAYTWGPLRIIRSDDFFPTQSILRPEGEAWRHVSVSCEDRLPSWDEIKRVRYEFFPADAEVIQVLPPKAEYRNCHPFCLHLWWCKDRRLTPVEFADAVAPKGS